MRLMVSPAIRFISAAILGLSSVAVHAQGYWPNEAQWENMRAHLASDTELRQVMEGQRKLAEEALHSTPQPIETASAAGRLQGDAKRAQTEASLQDMRKIQALAVAYAMYRQTDYARGAATYLSAWAHLNHPTGQPIDETAFEPGIFAYGIVRNSLDSAERQQIDAWWQEMARAEIATYKTDSKGTIINNWHSHRIKNVGLIGFALHDENLIAYARQAYRAQIQDNLRADGASIDFIERDALSYHVYDLQPLLSIALAFSEHGENLYSWRAPSGASLVGSLTWLLPYTRGEKTHAEFVGSHIPFDIARSKNHEQGHEIGSLWKPSNAVDLLDKAASYDSVFGEAAVQINGKPRLRRILSSYLHS